MRGYLTLDLSQFLLSISTALDAVEWEVLGTTSDMNNHAKRVAVLSLSLGRKLGFSDDFLSDLAYYAALHDNALTEFIVRTRQAGSLLPPHQMREGLSFHCSAGEKNLSAVPFHTGQKNVILYHHENVDGSGMFGLKGENIPLMSRIIRIFDDIDSKFLLRDLTYKKLGLVNRYLDKKTNTMYDKGLAGTARLCLKEAIRGGKLSDARLSESLHSLLPVDIQTMSYEKLDKICGLMAHIIDYKSPFTMRHSTGIAEKSTIMARLFDLDQDTCSQIHIAALLHDVGKLAIPNSLLEKPAKLTSAEYEKVKRHVWITHQILSPVEGFSELEPWASGHHERLDGSGYFRGSTGKDQDFCMRLLECVDVYQALVEERPYRDGLDHEKAMDILRQNVDAGKLDGAIVSALDTVFK